MTELLELEPVYIKYTITQPLLCTRELIFCLSGLILISPRTYLIMQAGSEQHAYLILSRRDSSMILQTGQEINELDSSGFATAQTTVFAGNLGGRYCLATPRPSPNFISP